LGDFGFHSGDEETSVALFVTLYSLVVGVVSSVSEEQQFLHLQVEKVAVCVFGMLVPV
jgi:hypothetical protein